MTNSKEQVQVETSDKKTGYKLTEQDFKQINLRSLFAFQAGWNYERMQGSGYLYTILPQLRKIYGDKTDELKEAMKTHAQFFNTSNFFNTIVTGIDLAIEEEEGAESLDTVAGLKAGLMGPFAAIGDSLFAALVPTIFGAIAANLASQGNPFGVLLWVAAGLVICVFRWRQLKYAYREGSSLVNEMQGQLSALTEAASLMGVFMVGGLIATMVNVEIAFAPEVAGVTVNFQNILDQILPKMVPALIVGFVYWLLGKKNITSTKAIFIVLILSIALSALGVLG
ncbi:PTS system mannose/fructose/sorbose family transporter subunit IID [Aerococcus sp. UMB7834]|uniref:PTS system mannose/fructose/sorbose family transporter subunit IID n=1 Tax=Aerococcus sp. UMB7834 TaxID=3046342 RepID=UPI00254B00D4|nr:PTS system mannose/fructose/sorbose family transporter subunit IID [Aerococcus sp. UMB7834]MDK6804708.1 PTS system mannose/fructose/sorbose family transporter subunit IID [Aerococcus sp. UMB7834]